VKSYAVKEIFYTIQGEGANAGRAAVFVRFAGCNGWSGLERDRKKGPFPCSMWCDTDFNGGLLLDEGALLGEITSLFPSVANRFVVFTGGEPGLQLTNSLLKSVRDMCAQVAIETNGSVKLPEEAFKCYLTVSPKTEKVIQDKCSELKLIYPTIDPSKFDYITAAFRYLQPLHDKNWQKNTDAAVAYVKANPRWKLSVQTHKFTGQP
jgi:organic radical activating enzyme